MKISRDAGSGFAYERKHCPSAGHIDGHEWDGTSIKICVILDDASRMVLAGGEFLRSIPSTSSLSSIKWLKGIGGSFL